MLKITVVGGGNGGKAIIELLGKDPQTKILGLAEKKEDSPAIDIAKQIKIPIFKNYKKMIEKTEADLIINVTDNDEVRKYLKNQKVTKAEIVGGNTTKFLWDLIQERKKYNLEIKNRLEEHKALYQAGIILTQKRNLSEVFKSIVKYACELTKTPAGSLAVYDEASGELYFGASKGFSNDFTKNQVWRLRAGGMTDYILNQNKPTVISDVTKHPKFDNPIMLKEGIMSLVATPLKAEGKIQGILYVDDFKARNYKAPELSVISLLANMAAFAIERAKLLEATRVKAITDELTKLYNLRHFLKRLEEEIERAKRYQRQISMAMIDIDHFKNYNDTFGHLKGNKVLKKAALLMEKESRDGDVVARYGGEEFVIIMPETKLEKAKLFAERLREKFKKELCDQSDLGACITISIGLASYPKDAISATDLIEKADEALYVAKGEGRNCVRIAKSDINQLGFTNMK